MSKSTSSGGVKSSINMSTGRAVVLPIPASVFGTGAKSRAASGAMERNVVVLSVARRVSLLIEFRSSKSKLMSTTGGWPGKTFEPDRMPPLSMKLLVGVDG